MRGCGLAGGYPRSARARERSRSSTCRSRATPPRLARLAPAATCAARSVPSTNHHRIALASIHLRVTPTFSVMRRLQQDAGWRADTRRRSLDPSSCSIDLRSSRLGETPAPRTRRPENSRTARPHRNLNVVPFTHQCRDLQRSSDSLPRRARRDFDGYDPTTRPRHRSACIKEGGQILRAKQLSGIVE